MVLEDIQQPKDKTIPEILTQIEKKINSDLKKRDTIHSKLSEILKEVKKEQFDIFSVRKLFDEISKELPNFYKEMEEEIKQIYPMIEQKYQEKLASYKIDLIKKCQEKNLKIEGEYPNITINNVIKVKLNFSNNSVEIGENSYEIPSIEKLIEMIIEEENRLWKKEFNAEEFLEQMYDSYKTLLNQNKYSFGEPILLMDIYKYMLFYKIQSQKFIKNPIKSNFIEYKQDEFSSDISKLFKERKLITKDGARIELQPISSRANRFWIYNPNKNEWRYRGYIVFKKEQKSEEGDKGGKWFG